MPETSTIGSAIKAINPYLQKGADYLKGLYKDSEADIQEQKKNPVQKSLSEMTAAERDMAMYSHMLGRALGDAYKVAENVGTQVKNEGKEIVAKAAEGDIAGAVAKTLNDATEYVAKATSTAAEFIAKSARDAAAEREATDPAKEGFGNATQPDAPALEKLGEPVLEKEGKSVDGRMDANSFAKLDAKKDAASIKAVLDQGMFVGDNFVQHGHLKMYDFSTLANKDDKGKATGTFGKSELSATEFTKAMAKLGFLGNGVGTDKKASEAIDARLKQTQDALKGTGLEKDGNALALLQAGMKTTTTKEKVTEKVKEGDKEVEKEVEKDITKVDLGIKDLGKSQAIDMLKDAKTLSADKKLKDVAAGERSAKANEVNQKAFEKYNGSKATDDSNKEILTKLGVDPAKLDQFSGAAYSEAVDDFKKLGNNDFAGQIKEKMDEVRAHNADPKNKDNQQSMPALNISLMVGSNFADTKGVYADASRGNDAAVLSQLSDERGFGKGINQLALVAQGEEGMNNVLQQIEAFKANFRDAEGNYNGPEINLDLSMFGHANSRGEMFMNANSAESAENRFGANKAGDLMAKVQSIVGGNEGSANITTWGCNTKATVDALASANSSSPENQRVGDLTITGTSQLAESSSGNLTSNDTTLTIKKDEDGQLMSSNVTTNGHGNDTYQVRQSTEQYQAAFKAKNDGQELTSQQFSAQAAEKAKETNNKISGMQGSDRTDDGNSGEGSISAGNIAEAKDRIEEEREKEKANA